MGVVPLLIFLHEASINTFLHLALDFLQPVSVEQDGDDASLRLFKFRFQFQVHLDQFLQERGGGKAPNTSS